MSNNIVKGLLEKILSKKSIKQPVGDSETLGLNKLERKTESTLKKLKKILSKYDSESKNEKLTKGILAKVLKK
jgi:hypothetical protein